MNPKNKIRNNIWTNYAINLKKPILTKKIIRESLQNFWRFVIIPALEGGGCARVQHFLIQFKIEDYSGNIQSISYVQIVSKEDLNILSNIFSEFWDIKSEDYHSMSIKQIIFTYKIIPRDKENLISKNKKLQNRKNLNIKTVKVSKFKFSGHNLPCTMASTTWGVTHFYSNYTKAIVYKARSNREYHINIFDNYILVALKIDNKTLLNFKDTLLLENSYDLYSFKREFKNQTFIVENSEIVLKYINRKTKFISKIKPSISLSEKFITMDLETRNINGEFSVYLASIYDGVAKRVTSFYLDDYKDSTEMLEIAILSIMKRKYDGYRVYLHNFSNFDGIFLIKILNRLSEDIFPLINDNKFIEIKFKFGNYCLKFRDSFLLLPSSLEKLATGFNVSKKETFPVLFVNNANIGLNYKGVIPPIEYFVNLGEDKYLEYCKLFQGKEWDLKLESIKYCNQDVITLYQIISKFADIIFDEIRLDISKFPTISSLSFGIFRCKFLREDCKIPIITGKIYNDISLSYTGGSVDVFKPYGENLLQYDVNSLYPFVMKENPMPVGSPVYFEGDISKYEKDLFGYFEVKVEAPKDLNIPLLQKRLKINSYKTVTPVGSWKGFYFSDELFKAKELNYKIEIIRGYLFKKEIIFKEFVDYFYEMKVNSEKNSPQYIIAKLILNSLYGRFGMSPYKEKHIITNSSDSFDIYNKFTVTNVINFDHKELISYLEFNESDEELNFVNISIPIASAVTAYARIFMYKFKTLNTNKCYYTDTDSVALEKKLDDLYVGKELGKFKLEYISEKAIFLAPKVYFCKTNLGNICKIKGFKLNKEGGIKFEEFYDLLYKDNKISLSHEKWKKNLSKGNITIDKEYYTLKTTIGKRELIFNESNKFVDTKPLYLVKGEIG